MNRAKLNLLRSARQGTHPPITVGECQAMLDRVPTAIWSGADGGFTTPAPHGRRTWWFGDTVSVNGWLHSSTMVQTDGLLEPDTRTVIPKDPDGKTVYWPSFATQIGPQRLLVMCGGIIPTEDFFEFSRMTAAYVDVGRDGRVTFDKFISGWPWDEPHYGNNAVRFDKAVHDPTTGILHAFAEPADTPTGSVFGTVHRSVPTAEVSNPDAWSEQTRLVPAEHDGSWSPWRDPDTRRWHALALSPDRRSVYVYSADEATGPWSKAVHDFPLPPDNTPGEFFYATHAHPWLTLRDDGGVRMLACTVSHTSSAGGDPHDYRPRFYAVPYPRSGDAPLWAHNPSSGVTRIEWNRDTIYGTEDDGVVTLEWGAGDDITTATEGGRTIITWNGD